MEPVHRAKLARSFPVALRGKRVVCLDVPDDYGYMDPELLRLLRDRVARAVPTRAVNCPGGYGGLEAETSQRSSGRVKPCAGHGI
jgi:hypothetical protein